MEVICDEIESYNDSPAELIYDEFENILFKGSPLGHNILGTAEQVRSFKTEDALRFTRKLYRPDNAIFFAYGDIDFKKLLRLLKKSFLSEERRVKSEETTFGDRRESQFNSPEAQAQFNIQHSTFNTQISDFRDAIRPKKPLPDPEFESKRYYQVYGQKYGFQPNMSILDLLFNEGNEAIFFL